MTFFPWPEECGTQVCGVWAKVDPTYLDVGIVYGWWGYNPEGFDCELDEDRQPTCEEEKNNIRNELRRLELGLFPPTMSRAVLQISNL